MTKAMCLALCAAMLLSFCLVVSAENVDEAWDVGENYVYYGTYLAVGEGEYTMSELYDYTLFGFMPDETGKYTFTVTDGLIGLASHHAMWVTVAPSESTVTESSVSWECTGVGQEIWLAVITDAATASIKVEAGESDRVVIEKIEYANKVAPEAFTFPGDASLIKNVNTMNSTVDTAVLGSDGYYHLNSADGYILYANLNDSQMSLSAATSYGQLKGAEYNEDGELVAIIDYNNAFAEYFECVDAATYLYPLTEDLMTMFQDIGDNLGWYGADGWLGLSGEDAWMFACYYTEEVFEEEVVLGDLDGDGQVNGIDSNYLMRAVAGTISIESGSSQEKAADVNGDGQINAIDTNMLKRILAGA